MHHKKHKEKLITRVFASLLLSFGPETCKFLFIICIFMAIMFQMTFPRKRKKKQSIKLKLNLKSLDDLHILFIHNFKNVTKINEFEEVMRSFFRLMQLCNEKSNRNYDFYHRLNWTDVTIKLIIKLGHVRII